VWSKAIVISSNDPALWRKDEFGAWIFRGDYDNDSEYGWVIEKINAVEKDNSDHVSNLKPLHHLNSNRNSTLGHITSDGTQNTFLRVA